MNNFLETKAKFNLVLSLLYIKNFYFVINFFENEEKMIFQKVSFVDWSEKWYKSFWCLAFTVYDFKYTQGVFIKGGGQEKLKG